jgi:hypothetical protein
MANVTDVDNHSGGNPEIVLRCSKAAAIEIICLHHANGETGTKIPIKTDAATEGAADTFYYTPGRYRDAHVVLRFAKKTVEEDLVFIPAQRILRPDEVVVRGQLRSVVPAGIHRHAPLQLEIKSPSRVPSVQVRIIGVADRGGIEAHVGVTAENLVARRYLGNERRRQRYDCQTEEEKEDKPTARAAFRCNSHSYKNYEFP